MRNMPPDHSPEQWPTTSLPTTTTLIPTPTPTHDPQAAISNPSLFTLSRDLTNYLLGQTPFITDHPFTTLFAGAALALSARFISRDRTRRSRRNVQLAVFHILKILQAHPQYYNNVSEENNWTLVLAQIETEVERAVKAAHLSKDEGKKVTIALKRKLWDKNWANTKSMEGESVAKRRKLDTDQVEDDVARDRYMEDKDPKKLEKKKPKRPSFPPPKTGEDRQDDDDDDDDGRPPPGGGRVKGRPGTPYPVGIMPPPGTTYQGDIPSSLDEHPQLHPIESYPNGRHEDEDSDAGPGLPPVNPPTDGSSLHPPATATPYFNIGSIPSGSNLPAANPPSPDANPSPPNRSDQPPMPSNRVPFTETPPSIEDRVRTIGPIGKEWWPCEFCKRMIWVPAWQKHVVKDSHIRRKEKAGMKRRQNQMNASKPPSAGPPAKKGAGKKPAQDAPKTVPPGEDPNAGCRYCGLCNLQIPLERWDEHLESPRHQRMIPRPDDAPDDDLDDDPDNGPDGNTDAFGQQIRPHKTNTPAPPTLDGSTPAPPSSQELDTIRRTSQDALANPVSTNVTVAPDGQVTLTSPVSTNVIVAPDGQPNFPLLTPAVNRRHQVQVTPGGLLARAEEKAYHTVGLKTPQQYYSAAKEGLSPVPELEEGDEGFGTPKLPPRRQSTRLKNLVNAADAKKAQVKKPAYKVGKRVYSKKAKLPGRSDPLEFLDEEGLGDTLDESRLQEDVLAAENVAEVTDAAAKDSVDPEEEGEAHDEDDLYRDDSRVDRPLPANENGTNPFEGVELASNDGQDDDLYANDGAAPAKRPTKRDSSRVPVRRNPSRALANFATGTHPPTAPRYFRPSARICSTAGEKTRSPTWIEEQARRKGSNIQSYVIGQ
ncbi:uncharacterized protein N0V89_010139 [Didymosphaeria variabile]|uniref:Uncharacterized protein n=1 Tax=Didymosphaeria variabile TaxID=1932322 RepID=A0A9W9C808_9PLEO|nr:uncharacterized protein N0V89_010139 [Didymosphaeria variabile]KAJ4348761.1 hypothetical protein N0V89_010139 [Didymosphaeria variabile]